MPNKTEYKFEKKNPKQELEQIPRGFVGDIKRTLAIRKQEEQKLEKKGEPMLQIEAKPEEPKPEEPKPEGPKPEEPKSEEENTIVTVLDVIIKPE